MIFKTVAIKLNEREFFGHQILNFKPVASFGYRLLKISSRFTYDLTVKQIAEPTPYNTHV